MESEKLRDIYTKRYNESLVRITKNLEKEIHGILTGVSHIDRISARAKSIDSFVKKASKKDKSNKEQLKYDIPLEQIQDQIGVRVIMFYFDDVTKVVDILKDYFTEIEETKKIPDSKKEFDYEATHLVCVIPNSVIPDDIDKALIPDFFELQVKTLYQHAFSESTHDLAYKAEQELTGEQQRLVAYTSAQSWGADRSLQQLFDEINSSLEP